MQAIKVHFLYGSRPKRGYKTTEAKYFGGLHGGHVSIEANGMDFGFEPAGRPVHVFPRRRKRAAFIGQPIEGARYSNGMKTVTFIIPVTPLQLMKLQRMHRCYADTLPFDYAFFGMRCASTTYEILASLGFLRRRARIWNILGNFYPRPLRKRMYRLSAERGYRFVRTEGRPTRKWERD